MAASHCGVSGGLPLTRHVFITTVRLTPPHSGSASQLSVNNEMPEYSEPPKTKDETPKQLQPLKAVRWQTTLSSRDVFRKSPGQLLAHGRHFTTAALHSAETLICWPARLFLVQFHSFTLP